MSIMNGDYFDVLAEFVGYSREAMRTELEASKLAAVREAFPDIPIEIHEGEEGMLDAYGVFEVRMWRTEANHISLRRAWKFAGSEVRPGDELLCPILPRRTSEFMGVPQTIPEAEHDGDGHSFEWGWPGLITRWSQHEGAGAARRALPAAAEFPGWQHLDPSTPSNRRSWVSVVAGRRVARPVPVRLESLHALQARCRELSAPDLPLSFVPGYSWGELDMAPRMEREQDSITEAEGVVGAWLFGGPSDSSPLGPFDGSRAADVLDCVRALAPDVWTELEATLRGGAVDGGRAPRLDDEVRLYLVATSTTWDVHCVCGELAAGPREAHSPAWSEIIRSGRTYGDFEYGPGRPTVFVRGVSAGQVSHDDDASMDDGSWYVQSAPLGALDGDVYLVQHRAAPAGDYGEDGSRLVTGEVEFPAAPDLSHETLAIEPPLPSQLAAVIDATPLRERSLAELFGIVRTFYETCRPEFESRLHPPLEGAALDDALERLVEGRPVPAPLREWFSFHDGSDIFKAADFGPNEFCSIRDAGETRRMLTEDIYAGEPEKFSPDWIPIDDNRGGDFHCVAEWGAGAVYYWLHEEPGSPWRVADSLQAWAFEHVQALLDGHRHARRLAIDVDIFGVEFRPIAATDFRASDFEEGAPVGTVVLTHVPSKGKWTAYLRYGSDNTYRWHAERGDSRESALRKLAEVIGGHPETSELDGRSGRMIGDVLAKDERYWWGVADVVSWTPA